MKRISLILVAIVCSLSFLMTGCGKKDTNVVRVNEVTHSIFYAPLYIAINQGFFEQEGIKIELTNGGGADKSMNALISGAADVGLMGPEAAIYVAEQGKKDLPVVFAQLTKRDGSFIIGREDIQNFDYSDLENKEILGGRRGGVPAMTLEYVLKQHGLINGQNITINYDVAFSSMTAAFIGNVGDFVTAFEPTASQMEANNQGYVLASVGELSGEVPYTAFMANESYIEKNTDKIHKFIRAIIKGYNYLMTQDIEKVVDALMPSFSGTDRASVKTGILAYMAIDAWVDSPVMREQAYYNLLDIMMDANELDERIPFTDVVDNSYANHVLNELAKP